MTGTSSIHHTPYSHYRYFFHVPKAGGISVTEFLRENLVLCNDVLMQEKPWLEGDVRYYNGCCDMPVYLPLMKMVEVRNEWASNAHTDHHRMHHLLSSPPQAVVTNEGAAYAVTASAGAVHTALMSILMPPHVLFSCSSTPPSRG
jgi:hypothetical protein